MNKFDRLEHVIIKKYVNDEINKYGVIKSIDNDMYWVTNLNMPYMGTISDFFTEDELEKI